MASDSLKKWFDRNDGKGWIDCKTGKPCGRKKVKNAEVILLVDQQKLNVPQRQKRKQAQKELAGKTVGQKKQKAVL